MSKRKLKYADMYKDKIAYEMDFWVKNGMRLGVGKYRKYLEAWDVKLEDLEGKVIADYGCGPFGGFTNIAQDLPERAYAIDPLFSQYTNAGINKVLPWVTQICATAEDALPNLLGFSDVGDGLDYAFSANALDHSPFEETDNVDQAIDNMLSALKPGGLFCLWVHLKRSNQLDYGHDFSISEERILNLINPRVVMQKFRILPFDHVNDPNNRGKTHTLVVKAEKR